MPKLFLSLRTITCSYWKHFVRYSTTTTDGISGILQDALVPEDQPTPKVDARDQSILLFSGQGSQKVGMASQLLEYPNVKEMFGVASDILNFDVLRMCENGPQTDLNKTVNCQAAIFLTSLAAIEKLQATEPSVLENCVAVAGYSIGEFAALVFAGAISFEDAVRLIGVRSRAMQRASESVDSCMVTAIGSSKTRFKQICEEARKHVKKSVPIENPVCFVAGYLCPNVVTIAGHASSLDFIKEHQVLFKIRKLLPIPVSGAFHTALMKPAADDLYTAMKRVEIKKPLIEVYSNVSAAPYQNPSDIKSKLVKQICMPVLWEQTMHAVLAKTKREHFPYLYEVGPGKQLGSLLQKCNGKAYRSYVSV